MTRLARNDPAQRLKNVVLACPVVSELSPEMVDHTEAWMVEHLDASVRSIRRLRQRLLEEVSRETEGPVELRLCEDCGQAVRGRADKRFCSSACRQRTHRNGSQA